MKPLSLLLPIYRLTSSGIRPLVPVLLHWRRRRGKEDRNRLRERMGIAGLPRPHGRMVWVHAASVADGQMLLPLVDRLGARGFNVLMSTRTLASSTALKRQLPAGAFHQFMPIDVPHYIGRFLDHWRPDMVLLAGAEFWPNVLIETHRLGVPIIFVNARLSDRIHGYSRRLPGFFAFLMRHIDLCLARSEVDAERFIGLGADQVQVVGDLAFDVPISRVDPLAVSAFVSRVGARPVWVAALIENEETAAILDTHRMLLESHPDLVTVIVPRLPRDGAAIVRAASERRLPVALRSRDGLPANLPGLFVADIAGEIGLYYRASGIAFIGRSFMDGGGRSPIEAAKLGCVVLHGPGVEGFSAMYTALDKGQGGAVVTCAASLAGMIGMLLEEGATLRLMQRNASLTIDRLCGGTARVMRAIEPHVVQMLVER